MESLQDITADNWQAWLLAGAICLVFLFGLIWCIWKAVQKAKEMDKPDNCSIDRTTYWLSE